MRTRIQMALSWALVLAVLFLTWRTVSGNDLAAVEDLTQIYEREQALLTRLERLPEREQLIKRKLADLGNEEAARFLYQGDDNAVQSLMQQDIRQLASQSDIRINRMRSLRSQQEQGLLTPSAIQVEMSTTHEALVKFVAEMEARQPLLAVRRLVVRIERASTEMQAASLGVSMELVGYRERREKARR